MSREQIDARTIRPQPPEHLSVGSPIKLQSLQRRFMQPAVYVRLLDPRGGRAVCFAERHLPPPRDARVVDGSRGQHLVSWNINNLERFYIINVTFLNIVVLV